MKLRDLFIPLILINIAAVAIGGYYYQGQLAGTPAQLLVFVPDCPFYVLLFLLVILRIIRSDAFSFLVSAGMVKYGVWTVFVLLFHWQYYSAPDMLAVTIVFILGHIGMALEGLAILPKKRVGALALAGVIAWLLLNDVSDYAWGTVPWIPRDSLSLVAQLTFASSLFIPAALFMFHERLLSIAPVRMLSRIIGLGRAPGARE